MFQLRLTGDELAQYERAAKRAGLPLAAKVKQAALDFDNQGAAADETSEAPMRFFPIDYRKDFAFVRQMDASFDPRFGQVPKASSVP